MARLAAPPTGAADDTDVAEDGGIDDEIDDVADDPADVAAVAA
jgi:hypothetical protein